MHQQPGVTKATLLQTAAPGANAYKYKGVPVEMDCTTRADVCLAHLAVLTRACPTENRHQTACVVTLHNHTNQSLRPP
jgi:hypothetical protein